jgi:hypothetical protein
MDVTNVVLQYTTNGASVSSSYVTNTYYSFVTNTTFYDYRESDTVNAIQIDVGQFGNWLTNAAGGLTYNTYNTTGGTSKGHNIDGVYVFNSVLLTGSQLPGVRVVNGAKLPTADGFTVATPDPLYVEGNYNTTTNNVNYSTTLGDTTNTWPAALMGDATVFIPAAILKLPALPCPPPSTLRVWRALCHRTAHITAAAWKTFSDCSKTGAAAQLWAITAPLWCSSPANMPPIFGATRAITACPSAPGASTITFHHSRVCRR